VPDNEEQSQARGFSAQISLANEKRKRKRKEKERRYASGYIYIGSNVGGVGRFLLQPELTPHWTSF